MDYNLFGMGFLDARCIRFRNPLPEDHIDRFQKWTGMDIQSIWGNRSFKTRSQIVSKFRQVIWTSICGQHKRFLVNGSGSKITSPSQTRCF